MKSIGIDMHINGIYMNTIYVELINTHMNVEFTVAVIRDVCLKAVGMGLIEMQLVK